MRRKIKNHELFSYTNQITISLLSTVHDGVPSNLIARVTNDGQSVAPATIVPT